MGTKHYWVTVVFCLSLFLQGQLCTEDVDKCQLQPNVCHNGGTCLSTQGGHTCKCVNGWTGEDCSENIDDCANAVCFNGATCHDRVASFYCKCPMGKTGLLCHLDDACVNNPCHKNATCDTNPINGRAICACPPGLTGSACDRDVDECDLGANPCEHSGRCVNTEGSFQCHCGIGYTGPRCEIDINECMSNPCQNNAICLDQIGDFTCICMAGFTGKFCELNVNECDSSPCVNGGVCKDGVNGFLCNCPSGFTGPVCEIDIDECARTPCKNGAKCVDKPNGYKCLSVKGQLCTEDECQLQPNVCHNGGTRISTQSGHKCVCARGWTGEDCSENIDDCANAACFHGATCHDRVASFYCECPIGKTGLLCHLDDACVNNPCPKNATCDTNPVNGRTICTCPPGFKGRKCDQDVNECSLGANPCEHFGHCVNTSGSFLCQYGVGYTGS